MGRSSVAEVATTREALAEALRTLRARGSTLALVPTMGALHAGHLSLFDHAAERADAVVASIFVNPLQFGAGEDLDRYPRDLARDVELAGSRGVRLVFAPAAETMYPEGEAVVRVTPGAMGARLCGPFRPRHFEGVLTVVAKLFGLIRPEVAVFGRKDLQQAALIRRMNMDLELGVGIDVAPLVRDADGMALSSRNTYLSAEERGAAIGLSQALFRAESDFRGGAEGREALLGRVRKTLEGDPAVQLQYAELVDPDTLDPLARAEPGAVLALAAVIGKTRLIDNVVLGAPHPDPRVVLPSAPVVT